MKPPTKVIGRRAIAAIIDAVPGFILYWALIVQLGDKIGRLPGTQLVMKTEIINGDVTAQLGGDVYHLDSGTFQLIVVVSLAYWLGVYVLWQGLTGRTIGKSLLGIRTVGGDGRPCGIGRAIVRWFLLVVDMFPYIVPLVGFLTACSSDGNRRLGDMAARTYVVKAAAMGEPIVVGGRGQPYGLTPPAPPGAWPPPRAFS